MPTSIPTPNCLPASPYRLPPIFFAFPTFSPSTNARNTLSSPSFRRERSITSSTLIVCRPACLRPLISRPALFGYLDGWIVWGGTHFAKASRSCDTFSSTAPIRTSAYGCIYEESEGGDAGKNCIEGLGQGGEGRWEEVGQIPICAQASSVSAPMNCGVAFTPSLSVSSSTILPMEYQRADLRRCGYVSLIPPTM